MPVQDHPQFSTPSGDTVLWRYMDFARFVQLLEYRSLWFSRTDQFEDPFEGTFTDAEFDYFKNQHLPEGIIGDRSILSTFIGANRMMRATTFINCWRQGAQESLAMWDLYGKGSGIVAIKTTAERLEQELNSSPTLHSLQRFPTSLGL